MEDVFEKVKSDLVDICLRLRTLALERVYVQQMYRRLPFPKHVIEHHLPCTTHNKEQERRSPI